MDAIYQTIDELKTRLNGRKARIQNDLGLGKATDFADYKQRTGRIRGIEDALTEIHALMERQETKE